MNYEIKQYDSPVGRLHLVSSGERLCGVIYDCFWDHHKARFGDAKEGSSEVLRQAETQLGEYFEGRRTSFDLPVSLQGTPFQKKVWMALAQIPFGETRTYKDQADLVGLPKGFRAVGRANGLNPLSIVLPCHRVIGKSGALTGYAGGIEAKRFLLELESASKEKKRA